MEPHRSRDAKSLLIATLMGTLAYGAAIVGSTHADASVDAPAVTRQLAAKSTPSTRDVAAAHTVR